MDQNQIATNLHNKIEAKKRVREQFVREGNEIAVKRLDKEIRKLQQDLNRII